MIDKKSLIEVIIFVCLMILVCITLLLTGCKQDTVNSAYYQTNYGEQCLYEPYTNTYKDLLFCQQKGLVDEHIQNELTNKDI